MVVRNLVSVEFRIRLLGQMTIKIDRSLNLKFRMLQNRRQKYLEHIILVQVRFFLTSKFVLTISINLNSFLDKNGFSRRRHKRGSIWYICFVGERAWVEKFEKNEFSVLEVVKTNLEVGKTSNNNYGTRSSPF